MIAEKTKQDFKRWWEEWLLNMGFISDSAILKTQLSPILKDVSLYKGLIIKNKKLVRKLKSGQSKKQARAVLTMNERKVVGLENQVSSLKGKLLDKGNPKCDFERSLNRLLKHSRVEAVAVDGDKLQVFTDKLHFGSKKSNPIGKMRITINNKNDSTFHVIRIQNMEMTEGAQHSHPNVSGGQLCEGSFHDGLRTYLQDMDLYFLIDLLIDVLENPGAGNTPYILREYWKREKRQNARLTPEPEKEATRFAVGDRIECTHDVERGKHYKGMKGTVVEVRGNFRYTIDWDERQGEMPSRNWRDEKDMQKIN